MAGNTRFYRPGDNKWVVSNATLINGNVAYTNAPPINQDAQFPMTNLLTSDRYLPWVTAVGPGPGGVDVVVDLDAGANVTPQFVGFFALRQSGVASMGFDVQYQTGATYNGNGTWVSARSGTISSGSRDVGYIVTGAQAARYWRFRLNVLQGIQWSIGNIFLSAAAVDLGIFYSPGMEETIIHPTIGYRTTSGHFSVSSVGDTRAMVIMPFRNIEDAIKAKINSVFGRFSARDPAVWIDQNDVARQVVLANSELRWVHQWAAPNLWDCDLEIEVLG